MSAGESLSAVDRAWLSIDRASNPMMIVGLIVLAAPLKRTVLRDLIAERFLAHERFLCVPVPGASGASWVPAQRFDVDDQVLGHALPAPAGQAELERLVGELASTPFNPGRPLWSFHLVERYGRGSALIARIHHAYADGIALLHVLLSLADGEGDRSTREPHAAPPPGGGLVGFLGERLRDSAVLTEKAVHFALHPAESSTLVKKALGLAGELAHVGLLSADPPTRLKRSMSGTRRVAWAEPLVFEEIRLLGEVLGCTVNDILMSVLAGALGRYLASKGDDVAGLTLRAAVPYNLRAPSDPPSLGNYFGLVFVELPLGIRHPLQRLYAVRTAMQTLKRSPQALVTLGILALVGSLPPPLEEPIVALFSSKASVVASNVRGPTQTMHLGGAPIAHVLFWVPQAGDIGIGVSMLSYAGQLQLGVMADRELVPEPAELVQEMVREYERLVFLLLLGLDSQPL